MNLCCLIFLILCYAKQGWTVNCPNLTFFMYRNTSSITFKCPELTLLQEDTIESDSGPLTTSIPGSVSSHNAQCSIIEGIHKLRPLTLSSHCPSQDWEDNLDHHVPEALTVAPDGLETDVPTPGQKDGSSEEDLDTLCDGELTSQQIKRAVGNGIMNLGLSYLERLKPSPELPNVIISPISLSVALSQLMLGKF